MNKNEKAQQALNQLLLIRQGESYRIRNAYASHLNLIERERLQFAIEALQELLQAEKAGV